MEEFVWLNDDLIPLAQARVSLNDRGFLYGDGLFETLRADGGRVHFLAEHLERLAASARTFSLPFPANTPWQKLLGQLLAANGLSRGPARVKILLTRGEAPGLGLPEKCRPTLVMYAQPYIPPSLALASFRHPRLAAVSSACSFPTASRASRLNDSGRAKPCGCGGQGPEKLRFQTQGDATAFPAPGRPR